MVKFKVHLTSSLFILSHPSEYIVLENLTGKYRCPCILDLKVGTRSYTDVMSPNKRQEHMERSASSTSQKLGIRLGGMHVRR